MKFTSTVAAAGLMLACWVSTASPSIAEPYITVLKADYTALSSPGVPAPSCEFTSKIKNCDGKSDCPLGSVNPDHAPWLCGDPASGVLKYARVIYTCNWTAAQKKALPGMRPVPPGIDYLLEPVKKHEQVMDNETLTLSCKNVQPIPVWRPIIHVIDADYFAPGTNQKCGFKPRAELTCNGRTECNLTKRVDAELCPGDPANGVVKTARVKYECWYRWYKDSSQMPKTAYYKPSLVTSEANDGSSLSLICN